MSYFQGRSYKRSLYKGYAKSEGFIDEQLNNLLLSRKAYIGSLTKRINKITLYIDETKVNKTLEICTEQEFRVMQIRKSINSFLIENFPEEELISLNS